MLAKPRPRGTTDRGRRTTDTRRRGVTLVEMLVTVAVLVIMMTILVQIFQAATGALSGAQAYQQLDDQLRRLDGIMRADFEGVTARFTPPLDPAQNLGYFEYGENEFADSQGEDGDDYIRFTAKAPPGQPFTGRFWANYYGNGYNSPTFLYQPQPITITSDYAEIIYFVRNGNLYRRVLLIAPEMQAQIQQTPNNKTVANAYPFHPTVLNGNPQTLSGTPVSWQGVNDLSAHPAPTGNSTTVTFLNTLGHLTNRENRAFYPRFANDFLTITPSGISASPDGIPDDSNGDNVPDLYPTLYPHVFNTALINSPGYSSAATGLMAFPYVFPGAYSRAQAVSSTSYGWIHAPAPYALAPDSTTTYQFDTQPVPYLQYLNHNPLDLGDNLPVMTAASPSTQMQTWWGFPTWRETLSAAWTDPTTPVFSGNQQPPGLTYGTWNGQSYPDFLYVSNGYLNISNKNLLPPMISSWTSNGNTVSYANFRYPDQLFSDGAGVGSIFLSTALWQLSWEDDLIMTGVRSFDVKAYDNALSNYADLGWGDDLRLYAPYQNLTGAFNPTVPPYIASSNTSPPTINWPPVSTSVNPMIPVFDLYNETLAHEGRMPPLITDLRFDSQYGAGTYSSNTNYTGNIGDNAPGIVRLRRVWDSWSTDYSRAPGTGLNASTNGFPIGPPFSPPVYPSYPPPYPAPLRGVQIQVRVVDPSNQRVKQLTIRQDFTDKL